MNKIQFDSLYAKDDTVIHCDIIEKANEFLTLTDSFGYKWCTRDSFVKNDKIVNNWNIYEKNTCYCLCSRYYGQFSTEEFYSEEGMKVIEYGE